MGHLINPIAFRLGYTRSWEDNWFTKNIYYPEFLHSIMKIRNYVYYFWTTRYMEKKGFLISHLYIYKFIKNLLIKVYVYNTDMEKYTYSFFVKGFTIFSDSFYYRLKKRKKKKKSFFYERYKPDFFFTMFLYLYFFLKKKKKVKLLEKKKHIKYNKIKKDFLAYDAMQRYNKHQYYLNKIKNGDLHFFFKFPRRKNNHLIISKYEEKIRQVAVGKLNMCFFDFIMYLFFKINMLEKKKEDILQLKKRRRQREMIFNYPLKIKRLFSLLKKYMVMNLNFNEENKKSIKGFLFFLTFMIELLSKIKKNRFNFKLREFNLRLIRLLFFNRVFSKLGSFFSGFMSNVLYLLSNIKNYDFRLCLLSNSNLNAKFLARYIGFKLKRKFPLFFVINPIKKELKKLFFKTKEYKFNLFFNLFNLKNKKRVVEFSNEYKLGFKNILLYLNNKYISLFILYYNKYKTLISFDFYIYFLLLQRRYKNQKIEKKWFYKFFFEKKWKKKIYICLNNKWIFFLNRFIKVGGSVKKYILKKQNFMSKLYFFIKNNLLINLFFGINKYNIDVLTHIYFYLEFNENTFFFINTKFINLFMYFFFNNYIFLNLNTLLYIDMRYLIISSYFFKSYMYYNYNLYSFNKFFNNFKINKKKNFFKMKELNKRNSAIMGFKMSFKGRFARKQRASSIWFHQGFVPLNTVKAIIDYAFFTIPLKNSAVSVKLWLYKNTEITSWHYKFYNNIKISIN